MRKLEYLSPTSLGLFLKNQDEFYLNYLADSRMPREPQTLPMCAGSSFDAYVKSYLYKNLIGKADPRFELDALLTSQVEKQNLDVGRQVGLELFEKYKASGALADLMLDLSSSVIEPKFEISIKGTIGGYREGAERIWDEVVLLGKPDVLFMNKEGARINLDFKVNGFYSKYNTTPMKGYLKLYDNGGSGRWLNEGMHRDVMVTNFKGIRYCGNLYFETLNADWARQLTIYAWLCGENLVSDCIHEIDQLCCKPHLRIAIHRLKCSKTFQRYVFDQAVKAWEIINSDHFFRNLTKAESQSRCQLLEDRAKGVVVVEDEDAWFNRVTRK